MDKPVFYTQINGYIESAGIEKVVDMWDNVNILTPTGEKLTYKHLDDVISYNKHLMLEKEAHKINLRKEESEYFD